MRKLEVGLSAGRARRIAGTAGDLPRGHEERVPSGPLGDEGLVREGERGHVRAEEGRPWNKPTGALDLHWREVHARDDVAPRQPARDRNAAPASQIQDWRASGNPRLDQLEPSRVVTVVRV